MTMVESLARPIVIGSDDSAIDVPASGPSTTITLEAPVVGWRLAARRSARDGLPAGGAATTGGVGAIGAAAGVAVNGTPIGRAALKDGDRIDVASTTLIFRRDED